MRRAIILIIALAVLCLGQGYGPTSPVLERVVTLTNAQVTTMFSAPTLIIPAPPAGSVIFVDHVTLENINGGTAYTGGGAIALFYGSASPPSVQAGPQIPATFMTSQTVTQITVARGGVGSIAASAVTGQAVYIGNLTQNFAQAGNAGTMRVEVQYVVTPGW